MKLSRFAFVLSTVVLAATTASAQGKGSLRIAAIDVEGGQATLFVAPGGQSLLVDTGWAGNNGRDAGRIANAAKSMGVTKLDAVLITHFHSDHVGGVPQLVERIPVSEFLDHGPLYEKAPDTQKLYDAYQQAVASSHAKHVVVRAGEKLPVAGFDAVAISSNGDVMQDTLPGAGGTSPLCEPMPKLKADETENGHSLGILIRFAGLKILDAGDLTLDRERGLVCPVNRIGKIDLAIVSHHGSDLSSSKVFVHTLQPRVAIMDNGARKGGSTTVIDTYRSSPGIEALYQLHEAPPAGVPQPGGTTQGGPEHNVPADFIANPGTTDGQRVDVAIHSDGVMDVNNGRGVVKHFARR
jgi:beta-lactamase superfamily II metal-dependent hydrolase